MTECELKFIKVFSEVGRTNFNVEPSITLHSKLEEKEELVE